MGAGVSGRSRTRRILIYSHDSFGLGHLRRCRTIAHGLVDRNKDLSILILSGSPIIGSFEFRSRVDFVRIPGVIKLRNGDYTSLGLHIDIEETLAIRASIIRHTAEAFDPDLLIVDKEPLGLRGEVRETLLMLKERGVPAVLGLRDVMDDPVLLAREWERKRVLPALEALYDEVWVYGLATLCDPLAGIAVPAAVRARMVFTGYLRRELPAFAGSARERPDSPYLLVTAGGGGDGEALIDWVLRAYETDPNLPLPAVVVFGPFMSSERQAEFAARAAALTPLRITTTRFETNFERLVEGAAGVVAMGGYNTFCEILSFDRPALIVPRTAPRQEQLIRAERAQELGLTGLLGDDGRRDPAAMAAALRRLPSRPPPSAVTLPGLLDGLGEVNRLTCRWLDQGRRSAPEAAPGAAPEAARVERHGRGSGSGPGSGLGPGGDA